MERDFLGMNGNASEDNRHDSDFTKGSAIQWPFSTKVTSLLKPVSFKAAKEEKPTKIAFDHQSTSGFRTVTPGECFSPNQRASAPQQEPQKCFNIDMRGAQQFPVHSYQPQSIDSFGTSSHCSIPIATSSPFFKVYGSSSSSNLQMTASKHPHGPVGNFTRRNVPKPSASTAQLTIFYAGSVNVYDDVPLEKARTIMFVASKGCNTNSSSENQRPQLPIPTLTPKVSGVDCGSKSPIPTQTQIQNPVSSPISISSHLGVHSMSGSSNADEVAGMKGVVQVPSSVGHHEATKAVTTSVPMLPRAVPQARKASLARFLEKRKERVTSTMPYFSGQKSTENSTVFEDANVISKCSSADISHSSDQGSWGFGQHRSSTISGDFLSTELEM